MPTPAQLRERLSEAESALHKLVTGMQEVTVSIGGFGATTYAQSSITELRRYIAQLKSEIAVLEKRPRRGPIFITF